MLSGFWALLFPLIGCCLVHLHQGFPLLCFCSGFTSPTLPLFNLSEAAIKLMCTALSLKHLSTSAYLSLPLHF